MRVPSVEQVAVALEPADPPAGLAHQQHPGGDVPGMDPELPEAVLAPGGDIGQIERADAEPAQAAALVRDPLHLPRKAALACLPVADRQAAADERHAHVAAPRDPDAPVVEIGTCPLLGHEQLVAQRIEDDARHDLAVLLERDRDGPVRQGVKEIGGAVDRVDDPAIVLRAAGHGPALLHEKAPVRPGFLEIFADHLLGPPIGRRDEVARALDRDLKLLDLAEIAGEDAGGAHGGPDHHLEIGGACHRPVPAQSLDRST